MLFNHNKNKIYTQHHEWDQDEKEREDVNRGDGRTGDFACSYGGRD
jgi:hypothetical protein